MASQTTHYQLTKPASDENYDIEIFNLNFDNIDAQMYQNQTIPFRGATSSADGLVGNVPTPLIADKDKFLKGDGTWATPSGGGGGGTAAAEMSLSDYNALTTQQKNDGTIRFIPAGSGAGTASALDMSNITVLKEGSMAVAATSSTKTTVAWAGGSSIGCTYYYTTAIDVTGYDVIRFTATNGQCFNGTVQQAMQARWDLQVGLQAIAPSSVQVIDKTDLRWVAVADMPYANYTYNESIDVSELTGTYYLVVNAHGWNAVIDDITLATGGAYPSQIKYMSKTYADRTGGGSGGGIDYSTSEQDTGLKWIDGSEIYQKTINIVNSSSPAATRDVDLSSYVPSGARILEFSGMYEYVYSGINYGMAIGSEIAYGFMWDDVYKLRLKFGSGSFESDEINLTIKYTKASS